MSCTVRTCALLWIGVISWAATGRAESKRSDRLLGQAVRLIDDLEYDRALKVLQSAWQLPDNDRKQLGEILWWMGYAQATLGKDGAAEEAFKRLVGLDPKFRPGREVSPKIRAPLIRARAFWRRHLPLSLRVEPAKSTDPEGMAFWKVFLNRETVGLVRSIRLSVQSTKGSKSAEVPYERSPAIVAMDLSDVLEAGTAPQEVRYFVQALTEHGGVVLAEGSRVTPERAELTRGLAATAIQSATVSAGNGAATEEETTWYYWAAGGAALAVVTGIVVWLLWPEQQDDVVRVPIEVRSP